MAGRSKATVRGDGRWLGAVVLPSLSANVCSSTIPLGMKNRHSSLSVLELVQTHSPCADEKQLMNPRKPTTHDVARTPVSPADSTGKFQFYIDHIVTMGFGTPEKMMSLILDTSSDLTWIQCNTCPNKTCRKQEGSLFNPSMSSSYSHIPCKSTQCSIMEPDTPSGPICSKTGNCIYDLTDSDGNEIKGDFSRDTLTIAPNILVHDFKFGCTYSTKGTFGLEAGLLALGRSNTSIVSQTANKFNQCFSYCFPSSSSSKGFLTLGKDNSFTKIFTPLIIRSEYPYMYFINIIAISVDGRDIKYNPNAFLSSGNTYIDSSIAITELPSAVYNPFSTEFRWLMLNKYRYKKAKPPSDGSSLDICFVPHKTNNSIPSVSFTFKNNVKVNLDFFGIVRVYNASLMCLAFTSVDDNMATFGITQQKTFEVVYDVGGHKLWFIPNRC
ncbi:Eukaryotic aspartyl protease family protein [Striga hermonthica]|uniref:Eukaryotic aspartyl protease family protein n=1 Tax=Striga hermonthica TaxID=68872 RepID=A0A9N7MX27_STRHE|nr:Eukaryotic aspartyl protease family protein [Striga hermonthica]